MGRPPPRIMRWPRPHGSDRRVTGVACARSATAPSRRTRPPAPRTTGGTPGATPAAARHGSSAHHDPTGWTDGPARATPPRSCRHGSPPTPAPRVPHATRYPPAPHPDPGPTGGQSPAAIPCCCGTRLTDSGQLRRWQVSEGWRTMAGGGCQAMRVRPTPGAQEALGGREWLKVAGCLVANRPERFAG